LKEPHAISTYPNHFTNLGITSNAKGVKPYWEKIAFHSNLSKSLQ
jgi:hypothetical protein